MCYHFYFRILLKRSFKICDSLFLLIIHNLQCQQCIILNCVEIPLEQRGHPESIFIGRVAWGRFGGDPLFPVNVDLGIFDTDMLLMSN